MPPVWPDDSAARVAVFQSWASTFENFRSFLAMKPSKTATNAIIPSNPRGTPRELSSEKLFIRESSTGPAISPSNASTSIRRPGRPERHGRLEHVLDRQIGQPHPAKVKGHPSDRVIGVDGISEDLRQGRAELQGTSAVDMGAVHEQIGHETGMPGVDDDHARKSRLRLANECRVSRVEAGRVGP